MIYPEHYVVWDFETTGLDPKVDKILEIGAIKVKGGEIVEERSWLLNPGVPVPEVITQITSITQEMVDKDGVDPQSAMEEFLEMFEPSWLYLPNVTHNGYRFDIPFLFNALSEAQLEKHKGQIQSGCIDTAVLYKGRALRMDRLWSESFLGYANRVMNTIAKGVKYNVGHCCDDLSIDRSQVQQHRALGDVKLTNLIYRALVHENK